ncbi:mitochondrial 4-hydroxybenzoate polyprenyltransferase [Podospora australis]|uniref:Mitochondrial 4-hydroxybenzoate polyprenyltransferase n=1 Tax=Podospora australis TaxID=1536484 RepID=A0AAN6WKW3_9PEZI|nr:mitochondrial 4-hydroxybenzoate polyprenyltransferase [Podospora australis]
MSSSASAVTPPAAAPLRRSPDRDSHTGITAIEKDPLLPHHKPLVTKEEANLSQQYGGETPSTGWVSRLPASWVPYIQLARLSPPAALALIFFPHFFGALLSAIVSSTPPVKLLNTSFVILLPGSFFFSNAAHAWNDLIDAPYDRLVSRTKKRPIARGAISPSAAFIFCLTQAIGAAAVLWFGFPDPLGGIRYVLPNILGTAYYPYAKRHTHFSQIVLGACLAWGVVVGFVGMEVEPFSFSRVFFLSTATRETRGNWNGENGGVNIPAVALFTACVLWSAIYDTIYAHQDLKDDVKLKLKSTAVLFRDKTKPVLWGALAVMLGMLDLCGLKGGMHWPYYVISLTGCGLSLGAMIRNVELKSSASCWWWFRYGFWLAGSSIAGGLVVEYLVRLGEEGFLL